MTTTATPTSFGTPFFGTPSGFSPFGAQFSSPFASQFSSPFAGSIGTGQIPSGVTPTQGPWFGSPVGVPVCPSGYGVGQPIGYGFGQSSGYVGASPFPVGSFFGGTGGFQGSTGFPGVFGSPVAAGTFGPVASGPWGTFLPFGTGFGHSVASPFGPVTSGHWGAYSPFGTGFGHSVATPLGQTGFATPFGFSPSLGSPFPTFSGAVSPVSSPWGAGYSPVGTPWTPYGFVGYPIPTSGWSSPLPWGATPWNGGTGATNVPNGVAAGNTTGQGFGINREAA